MRKANITRTTTETDITIKLNLDGIGAANIDTGIGFFDHMLVLFASHGKFDLDISCVGDTFIDAHHSAEDVGIVLGKAFDNALGDKRGIARYGSVTLPMDESLAMINLDLSGRPYLHYNVAGLPENLGDMESEALEEFFRGFVNHSKSTLHINLLYGKNGHHMMECVFKAFGRALSMAVGQSSSDAIPSTKGLLD